MADAIMFSEAAKEQSGVSPAEREGESAAAAGGSGAGYAQEVLEEIKRFDATILEDVNELLKASSGGVGMTEQEATCATGRKCGQPRLQPCQPRACCANR